MLKEDFITSADITDKNMERFQGMYKLCRYKAFKDRCPEDWLQSDTFIKSANAVYLKYKNKVQGAVYFHRGSIFMAKVYAGAKKKLREWIKHKHKKMVKCHRRRFVFR